MKKRLYIEYTNRKKKILFCSLDAYFLSGNKHSAFSGGLSNPKDAMNRVFEKSVQS